MLPDMPCIHLTAYSIVADCGFLTPSYDNISGSQTGFGEFMTQYPESGRTLVYVYLFISSIVALYKDSSLYFFPLLLKLLVSVSPVSILYHLSCFIQFPLFLVCK